MRRIGRSRRFEPPVGGPAPTYNVRITDVTARKRAWGVQHAGRRAGRSADYSARCSQMGLAPIGPVLIDNGAEVAIMDDPPSRNR